MGVYMISADEILEGIMVAEQRITFEDFLQQLEGDVSAEELAKAWNKLSRKHKWGDTLKSKQPW